MKNKHILLALLAVLIAAFFIFDLQQYLNLDFLKAQQRSLESYYSANPVKTIVIFFVLYVTVAALSLPGAAFLTLGAGAIFGLLTGTIIVSFASSIGATLAFLASRFIFRDLVEQKFGDRMESINQNFDNEGAFYLFTLRLVPVIPYFLVNLLMGLTRIPTRIFYLVSQVGMFPATVVFVNAGTQLAKIEGVAGILSPGLLLSFAVLGLFPLLAKKGIEFFKAKKVYEGYAKPAQFDRNLIVIGAGSGGLVSAYIAAAVKSKVTLIEKGEMGGDCLNTGCVPSKALIRTAKLKNQIDHAQRYGMASATGKIDFASAMDRVQRVIKKIEPHDSVERYTALGVECLQGEARITSPWTVEVNGQTLSTRNIIIASGARPFVPPIDGLDKIDYLTSDNLWQLREQPKRLIVLGGGPIGCELAQAFARLGSQVSQIEMLPRIMGREDPEIADTIKEKFIAEGINVLTDTRALAVELEAGKQSLVCEQNAQTVKIEFDKIIVAVGRTANVSGFGLEELGIELNPNRTVTTNAFLQTRYPNIFAVGDVAGPYQFTHVASHQAWYASVNALFGLFKKFKVDYRVIPWATFTDPEVARVGLNESDAKDKNIAYEVTQYGIDDLDRAIADSSDYGFIKVLTVPGKDKILGVTIVGEHAGDLIAEYVMAMKHNIGLNKVLGTIHIYPTLAESNKYVAGEWKRANAPEKLLGWIHRFHRWRLS